MFSEPKAANSTKCSLTFLSLFVFQFFLIKKTTTINQSTKQADRGKDSKPTKAVGLHKASSSASSASASASEALTLTPAAAAAANLAASKLLLKPENVKYNDKSVFFSRIVFSMAAGSVCGIAGFTGAMGFLVYLIATAVLSVGLVVKTKVSREGERGEGRVREKKKKKKKTRP